MPAGNVLNPDRAIFTSVNAATLTIYGGLGALTFFPALALGPIAEALS